MITRPIAVRLPLLFVAAVLAACAPGESPEKTGRVFETTLTATNAAGEQPGEFPAGEPITLTLLSANLTNQVQQIDWCSGERFDIAIYDSSDTLVWNKDYGLAFTQALDPDRYGPREQRDSSLAWD